MYSPFSPFGADPEPPPAAESPTVGSVWWRVKMMTPDWIKESATIAVGVFGGLGLFQMFRRKLPKALPGPNP